MLGCANSYMHREVSESVGVRMETIKKEKTRTTLVIDTDVYQLLQYVKIYEKADMNKIIEKALMLYFKENYNKYPEDIRKKIDALLPRFFPTAK